MDGLYIFSINTFLLYLPSNWGFRFDSCALNKYHEQITSSVLKSVHVYMNGSHLVTIVEVGSSLKSNVFF